MAPVIVKTPLAPKGNQILPKTRIAKRSINDSIQEDEIVEKILAKRFNPRKKQYEYLVKWEKFSHEQNTWEELSHFDQCKHLLDYFEEQLARQKEQRAKFQQIAQNKANAVTPAAVTPTTPQTPPSSGGGRPVRSSKSKAIDQVKQWCASDDDNVPGGALKRKNQSSADDDADDENQTDDADDDFNFSAKKLKTTENLTVQQALLKAGSTGNVRIMPVNQRTTAIATANKINAAPKVLNGGAGSTAVVDKQNSAEIVITKDAKGGTGVVKKPGATINNKNNLTEAKVRVLAKGEAVPSGVVRIATAQTEAAKTTTPIATRQATAITNRSPVVAGSGVVRSPNAIQQQQKVVAQNAAAKLGAQNKLTPVQKTQQQQQKRFSLSPEATSTMHNRTTITRVVRSNPGSAKTTPETAKMVTYRTADGKLVRRSFPPGQSPRLNTSKGSSFAKPDEEDDDDNIADPFPAELNPPEPDSPPLPMSLCPITGKVLLKAEGEKTPPPSPDPAVVQQQEQQRAQQERQTAATLAKQQAEQQQQQQDEQQQNDVEMAEQANAGGAAMQHIQPMTNEDGTPILVTGEDGTVYQIAGKNEEGQTILISQGADGEQQCVFVAADDDENGVLGLAQSEGTELNQMMAQEEDQTQLMLKQQDGESSNPTQTLTVNIEGGESQDGQITAEVVQAELPSPGKFTNNHRSEFFHVIGLLQKNFLRYLSLLGGTRRVVLLLPDGNLMMTEIDEEQYKSLNLVS